jgi:hypothetical protein
MPGPKDHPKGGPPGRAVTDETGMPKPPTDPPDTYPTDPPDVQNPGHSGEKPGKGHGHGHGHDKEGSGSEM